ncbi:MAG: thioredoxin family protein, partial [Planctomycetota bacterium]
MKVQILGTGCKKCNDLYANAEKAITETGATAELEKVTDLAQIMQFGV